MKLKFYLFSLIVLISLSACSTMKRYDDAVRIKSDKAAKYMNIPSKDTIRDGKTLRGTVVKILVEGQKIDCEKDLGYAYTASLIFLNEKSADNPKYYEKIPLSDVDLVSGYFNAPLNDYSNINMFENFNNPDKMRELRTVPVDTVRVDTCCPCRCQQFSVAAGLDFAIDLNCPERILPWYFLELRGGYAVYSDYVNMVKEEGADDFVGEAAFGVRFGSRRQWGLGVSVSSGVKTYNAFAGTAYKRPTVLLHLRREWGVLQYDPEDMSLAEYESQKKSESKFLGTCLRPFFYADFGLPVDKLSLSLPKFDLSTGCEDCKKYLDDLKASGQLPQIDFAWPLTYGVGVGIDIPLTKYMDLSTDIGIRSLGFGEETQAAGFNNVPSMRRIWMGLFRIGVTF